MKVWAVMGATPHGVPRLFGMFSDNLSASLWIESQHSPGYFEDPWATEYWIEERIVSRFSP